MLAYYRQHPMVKAAGLFDVPTALASFWKANTQALQSKLRSMRQPGYARGVVGRAASKFRPELIGGAAGIIPGVYMGNKAFNNSLPPVRTLPSLEQSPYIEVERPFGNNNGN
jgi:hypothetical protein